MLSHKGSLQTVTSPLIPFTKVVSGDQISEVSDDDLSDTCPQLGRNWLHIVTTFIQHCFGPTYYNKTRKEKAEEEGKMHV